MASDDVKTTGNPGGLWERVVRAWGRVRDVAGEVVTTAATSPAILHGPTRYPRAAPNRLLAALMASALLPTPRRLDALTSGLRLYGAASES